MMIDGLQGAKSEKCAGCRLVTPRWGGVEGFGGLEVWRLEASVPIIQCLHSCCIFGCTRTNTRISNHGENIVELFKKFGRQAKKTPNSQTPKLLDFCMLRSFCRTWKGLLMWVSAVNFWGISFCCRMSLWFGVSSWNSWYWCISRNDVVWQYQTRCYKWGWNWNPIQLVCFGTLTFNAIFH